MRPRSVDAGTTRTDSMDLERRRGITIPAPANAPLLRDLVHDVLTPCAGAAWPRSRHSVPSKDNEVARRPTGHSEPTESITSLRSGWSTRTDRA